MLRFVIRLALVLAIAATVPACLFNTRQPFAPASNANAGRVSLDAPEKPFAAIKTACEQLKSDNYDNAISEKFNFSPTLQDSLDQAFIGTAVYDGWTKAIELNVFELLLSDAQSLKVNFEYSKDINKSEFVRWQTTYDLAAVFKTAPADTVHYKGVAQIDVQRENGNWRIVFWNEAETVAGYATWGYQRGIYRLRTGS